MVVTLTFKLLLGSFFLCVFSPFFSLSVTKQKKYIFSAWNGDGQTSRGGGSLSQQPAGFEKAD